MTKNLNTNINKKIFISNKDKLYINKILIRLKIDTSKLSNLEQTYLNNVYISYQNILYKILFFDKYQKQLEIKNKVELFDFISIKDVIYIFKNYNNLQKILKYLIK